MADYPTTLPCPTWNYGQTMTAYQRRSPFDCGWTRQRLVFDTHGSSVELSFLMDTVELNEWTDWVTEFGYDWFDIELDQVGGIKQTYTIRMASPADYIYSAYDRVDVRITGEILDG